MASIFGRSIVCSRRATQDTAGRHISVLLKGFWKGETGASATTAQVRRPKLQRTISTTSTREHLHTLRITRKTYVGFLGTRAYVRNWWTEKRDSRQHAQMRGLFIICPDPRHVDPYLPGTYVHSVSTNEPLVSLSLCRFHDVISLFPFTDDIWPRRRT
jgi:hypothetical protein